MGWKGVRTLFSPQRGNFKVTCTTAACRSSQQCNPPLCGHMVIVGSRSARCCIPGPQSWGRGYGLALRAGLAAAPTLPPAKFPKQHDEKTSGSVITVLATCSDSVAAMDSCAFTLDRLTVLKLWLCVEFGGKSESDLAGKDEYRLA